jgi:hypothetical protein
MNDVTSLYEFILRLLRDQHARAEFRRDPRHVLERHGLHHVTADDIRDLMPVVVDHRAVQPIGDHAAVSVPSFAPAPGDGDPQSAVVHVIDHFMNNYTYNINDSTNFNDHSTTINDSMHTDIWGGDPSVTLDATNAVASAPDAVASGGAISGTVTTGSGDKVASGAGSLAGDGDAKGTGNVLGTGNTVADGAGDSAGNGNVTGTVSGSQVATTGGTDDNHPVTNTDSGNTTTHLTSFGAGATNTIGNGDTSTAAPDSHNTSDSHNASDIGNTTTATTHTTTTTTDSNDGNGNHIDHNALGNSYSATDVHDTTDTNDHVLHLDVH